MTKDHFVSIINPLKEPLYRFALWKTQNKVDAEDMVQEVVLKLWLKRDKLTHYHNIDAFAFKILRNLCIDLYRKRKFIVYEEIKRDEVYYLNLHLDQKEKLEIIEKEIMNFSEKHQTIFFLRNVQGLGIDEIAKRLDMKKNTVEVNLSRIRIKLLNRLEQKWYGEE